MNISHEKAIALFANDIEAGGLPFTAKFIRHQAARIKRLEEWIEEEGKRNDTCTFHILNKICSNCECSRKL